MYEVTIHMLMYGFCIILEVNIYLAILNTKYTWASVNKTSVNTKNHLQRGAIFYSTNLLSSSGVWGSLEQYSTSWNYERQEVKYKRDIEQWWITMKYFLESACCPYITDCSLYVRVPRVSDPSQTEGITDNNHFPTTKFRRVC